MPKIFDFIFMLYIRRTEETRNKFKRGYHFLRRHIPVTAAWRVLGLRMEDMASKYGG
jgi:hypothetical protein